MNWDNVKKIGKLLLKNIAQMLGIVLLFGGVGGIIFFATEFLIGIFGTWPALTIMGGGIVAHPPAQVFGLRARDEHSRPHSELTATELRLPQHILHRLGAREPLHYFLQTVPVVCR